MRVLRGTMKGIIKIPLSTSLIYQDKNSNEKNTYDPYHLMDF